MRKITDIILHSTATREGEHHTVADIRAWHLRNGWQDIGYHYVIYLDGSIHEGRPVEQKGAHCQGYNTHSIGVVYVGGVDQHGQPKDTRTPAQRQAMKELVVQLKRQYPGAAVHGHRYYKATACPSFDVEVWLKNEGIC